MGDGSLNVAGNDGGIYIAGGGEVGGLYLKENVSLTVASGNVSSTNSYGVRVDDVLEVHDNATLTASAGTALERSCGIYAYVAFNVYDNAVVTTTGTDQSVDQNTDSYGVRTTNMTIKGGTVTATGGAAASSNGIYTQTFDMYGGAVTAVSGSTAGGACFGPSTALQATKSFFCSGGTVTAASGSAGNDTSCGILVSNGHLVVDGGSLFAQSGKANFSYGIKASQLSLADGYIRASGAATASAWRAAWPSATAPFWQRQPTPKLTATVCRLSICASPAARSKLPQAVQPTATVCGPSAIWISPATRSA